MEMTETKRPLYILKPENSEMSLADFEVEYQRLSSLAHEFNPLPVSSDELRIRSQSSHTRSLEGGVLLIPSGGWAQGTLSDLTRLSDVEILALVSDQDGSDRVALWYVLGATMVLDQTSSPSVLLGAIAKLADVEVQTFRPQLTKKEGLVFEALRRAGADGLDRSELSDRIWSRVAVQRKTIDVHVFNLRRKLNSTRYRIVCRSQRFYLIELDAGGPEIAI